MSNCMDEKGVNEMTAQVTNSLDRLRQAIIANQDVSFIGLFRFEGENHVETYNYGNPDSILFLALAEIEGLAVHLSDDNVERAMVINAALQYLSDLRARFLDGSFEGRLDVRLDVVDDRDVPDTQTIIYGGEQ